MKNVTTVFATLLFVTLFSLTAKAGDISRDSLLQLIAAQGATTSQLYLQTPKERMSLEDSIAVYKLAIDVLEKAAEGIEGEGRYTVESIVCQLKAKKCAFQKMNGALLVVDCGCGGGGNGAGFEPSQPEVKVKKVTKKHTSKGKKFHGKRSRSVSKRGVFRPRGGRTNCFRF